METNNVETVKKAPKKKSSQLKITLVHSACSARPNQRKTVQALGLTKLYQTKIQPKNDAILGMINTVEHLVKVEEI